MTEELEKEANDYAEENQIYVSEYCSYNHLVKAYLAGAEPREKRIAYLELKIRYLTRHLEPQAMSALFEQVEEEVKQEKRIEELEAQIKKKQCCRNCKYDGGLVCLYETDCKNGDKWEIKEND